MNTSNNCLERRHSSEWKKILIAVVTLGCLVVTTAAHALTPEQCAGVVATAAVHDLTQSLPPALAQFFAQTPEFISKYHDAVVENMLFNISPYRDPNNKNAGYYKGAVAAGQGRGESVKDANGNTVQRPDYSKFVWKRDGGIVFTVLVDLMKMAKTPQEHDRYLQLAMEVLAYFKGLQQNGDYDIAKHDIQTMAPILEWMNPQSDGWAYFLKGGMYLLSEIWDSFESLFDRESKLRTGLSRSDIYDSKVDGNKSIIKSALEHLVWVANIEKLPDGSVTPYVDANGNIVRFPHESFEAWEEEYGLHFTNMGTMQAVLLEAKDLTTKIGDPNAGPFYEKVGMNYDPLLMKFWDREAKVIRPSLFVDPETKAVVTAPTSNQSNLVKNRAPKLSRMDSQVMIGIDHMKSPTFSPASDYSLATAIALDKNFGSWEINKDQKVKLWGRYKEDIFDGHVTFDENGNPTSKGRPWFLTNFYEVSLCFKRAAELYARPIIEINDVNIEYFNSVLEQTGSATRVAVGMKLGLDLPQRTAIVESQVNRGLMIAKRLMEFAGQPTDAVDLHYGRYMGYARSNSGVAPTTDDGLSYATGIMSEQIDPNHTGQAGIAAQRSDPSLTWTYAAYLRSVKSWYAMLRFFKEHRPGQNDFMVSDFHP